MACNFKAYKIIGDLCHETGQTIPNNLTKHTKAAYMANCNIFGCEHCGLVTEREESYIEVTNPFVISQYFEDNFPYLTYLAMGDSNTNKAHLTMSEAKALEAQYGPELAALHWFKQNGYDSVICWNYALPPGDEISLLCVF